MLNQNTIRIANRKGRDEEEPWGMEIKSFCFHTTEDESFCWAGRKSVMVRRSGGSVWTPTVILFFHTVCLLAAKVETLRFRGTRLAWLLIVGLLTDVYYLFGLISFFTPLRFKLSTFADCIHGKLVIVHACWLCSSHN